jgi:hypothetical protein
MSVILVPLKLTCTCTVPNWLLSALPSTTSVEAELFEVDGVDGDGVDEDDVVVGSVVDVEPVPEPLADVDGSVVAGAVVFAGGAAAALLVTGPGSYCQTPMNPAMDSATMKMVRFMAPCPLRPRG